MIQPTRGRILVEMLPATDDLRNPHRLTLVDSKRHFDYKSRKGKVIGAGKGVRGIALGDIVVFRGDAGFSLDYDPEQKRLDESQARWLKEADCLAVIDPEPQAVAEAAS